MQHVKFTLAVADGEGGTYRGGGTYELEQAEADHWVDLGFAELADDPTADERKTPRPKKAAAPRASTGTTKEAKPVTEQPKPDPKKAPAKRTAKKAATKKTATKRAPSQADSKA